MCDIEEQEFKELMCECGYDNTKGFTTQSQHVWNVAKCVWKHQQFKINKIDNKINLFKNSLESL